MKYLCILSILACMGLYGQTPKKIVYANENHNVAMIFPEPITQAITGAEHFMFSYNKEKSQRFGLLKAVPGVDSNLFVITADGLMFSYRLRYKEELPEWNYFVKREDSIGKEEAEATSVKRETAGRTEKEKDSLHNKTAYFRKLSRFYLKTTRGRVKSKRNKGLVLSVKDMVHNQQQVYLVVELKNTTRIDFELNSLDLFTESGRKRKNASFQKLRQKPVFAYHLPEKITSGERKAFVLVYPKFTLGGKEKAALQLTEKNGNRFIRLKFR